MDKTAEEQSDNAESKEKADPGAQVKEAEKSESTKTETEPAAKIAPTPNLSAWFKAFGAPKVPAQKKSENKEPEEAKSVPPPDPSPNPDSPVATHGQPAPRQRKVSTGSTVSERSSFSQDMDSPRVGIDERLYPAPYPSPLHRSPSGASPVMASPRPDVSPKAAAYPTVNGQIRVGFYQDTVSTKSSPEKLCSPRENPQSPYVEQHVYIPATTSQGSTYSYYSPMQNYSSASPNPQYNPEAGPNVNANVNSPSYYDTSKPLTDQYQAKTAPANYQYNAANSPGFQDSSSQSPNYQAVNSPNPNQMSQSPQSAFDTFRQQEKQQATEMFQKQQVCNLQVLKWLNCYYLMLKIEKSKEGNMMKVFLLTTRAFQQRLGLHLLYFCALSCKTLKSSKYYSSRFVSFYKMIV